MDLVTVYCAACDEYNCKINSAFKKILEQSAERKKPLVELDLSKNYIGNNGIFPVLCVVKKIPTLTSLNLSHNGLVNESVMGVAEALTDHMGITDVNLSNNPFSQPAGKALLDLATQKEDITELNVSDTDMYHALAKRIQMQVNINRETAKLKPQLTTVPMVPPSQRDAARSTSLFANPDAWSSYVLNREAGLTTKSNNTALDMTVLLAEQAVRERQQQKYLHKNNNDKKQGNLEPHRFQQQAARKTIVEASVDDGPAQVADLKVLKQQLKEEEELSLQHQQRALGIVPTALSEEEKVHKRLAKAELQAQELQKDFDVYAIARDGEYQREDHNNQPPKAVDNNSTRPEASRVVGAEKDSFTKQLEQAERDRMSADEKRHIVQQAQHSHGDLKYQQATLRQQEDEDRLRQHQEMELRKKEKEEREKNEREMKHEILRAQQEAEISGYDVPVLPPPPPLPSANVATSSSAPPLVATQGASTNSETHTTVVEGSTADVRVHTVLVNARGLTLKDSGNREEAEQFIELFERAGVYCNERNYEEAYETWSAALEKAKQCGQREWIAVVQGNLNNLSYKLLIEQGKDHRHALNFSEASHCFKLAIDVAVNANKPAWKEEAETGLVGAQLDRIQALHDAAVNIFDELIEMEQQHQTNRPKSIGEYVYPPPQNDDVLFQLEWDRVLKLKEAVELWSEAMKLTSIVYNQDVAQTLRQTLDESIHVLFQYQYKLCTAPSIFNHPTQAPCHVTTYTAIQREQLLQCWVDIDLHTGILNSRYWESLLHLLLCCYHFSVFHNDEALQHVITYLDIVNSLAHQEMMALGYTLLGSVHLQNKRWAEAEHALRAAAPLWESTRTRWDEEGKTMCLKAFVVEQHSLTYQYLSQMYVGRQQYLEALRMCEMSKVHSRGDYLYDKLKLNFEVNLTVDKMMALAVQRKTTIVTFLLVYEYDWDMVQGEMLRAEVCYSWVVPPFGEVKFVETKVTQDYNIDSLYVVVAEIYDALNLKRDSGLDQVVTQSEQLLPKWREPLQQLFDFLLYPINDFMAAVAGGDIDNKVLFIPDKFLWLVPYNLLMDNTGDFLVQQYVLSQAFCILQLAWNQLQEARYQEWMSTLEGTYHQLYHVFADLSALQSNVYPIELEAKGDTTAVGLALQCKPYSNTECTVHTIVNTLSFAKIVHFGGPVISTNKHKGTWGCLPLTPDDLCTTGLLHSADVQKMDCKCALLSFSNAMMCKEAVLMGGDGVLDLCRAVMCSGVSTVVLTMWTNDDTAAILAPFYTALYENRKLDPAIALAHAVRRVLAQQPLSPQLWGRFLHFGV